MSERSLKDGQHDRRIDYVEMASTNLANTKRFYSEVFDWKFTDYGPDYTSFDDGRISGGFYKADATQVGSVLIVIFALELETAEKRVQMAGGKIVKPIFDFPGGRRFHFADPSGNQLAVWSDR
jgi:predicted enzyme related to lactoylglutathione lyase